ncbi:assimilatory nitrate reductase catalytic subunit [Paenibacillus sp. UNCCL117]|uniref:molybdopterin oxidoreductase family protein n=1 Tax=unclassified Paenibacillus TaxID=185978 RepID=UPI00088B3462|nr:MULTISPECIES: molybdopterin oxidoreductase family protein [unclassified Paenibacillus]SDD23830.1 assimilatory nitrate reductase (NADH) alpha subunit apoprotein [Paenibacillus sp. cl123]SFW41604.1 assimilatory nitrate reductase catalytic subunit [Paenibacillus sp. UNCCL117]
MGAEGTGTMNADNLLTHCCFCSMQCGMELVNDKNTGELAIRPRHDFPVAAGRLCQKGLNALEHVRHPERVLRPLVRPWLPEAAWLQGGVRLEEAAAAQADGTEGWQPLAWEEAVPDIARRIRAIQSEYGRDAVGVYGGGSLSNEVCYLLGKFTRVALRSKYIDYNGRYCMSSAAAAGNQAFGLDRGMTMPLSDIPQAKFIILAGTNIAECQPTMVPYLLEAKKNGALLVTIDPRNTMTSKMADIHVRLQPGFDSVFVNGLLHVIIAEKLYDQRFVDTRTTGFEQLAEAVKPFTPERVEELTGMLEAVVRTIARGFAKAPTGIVLTARGLEQQVNGVENTLNYINLALLTGKIGRAGCGYGAVTGQANGQGGREHGQKADQLPGYRLIEDPAAREYVSKVWGIDPAELPGKGVSAYELLQKIDEGEIKALIVLGSNPVVSSPNSRMVERALRKLDLLVVIDMFETETAAFAHYLLPGSSFLEGEGTLTNLEGRVFHRPQALELPGEAKLDYRLICELAEELGYGRYFQYESIEEVFDELALATAGGKADYSGITYERLKREKGLFWPCPSPEHSGTPLLFTERFHHPDGRARLFGITPKMPAEPVDQDYPYVLTTGRVGSHYLSGAQTRRTAALHKKTPVPVAEIHPWLARRIGLKVGDQLRLTSRRDSVVFAVKVTEGIHPLTVFVPFHWGGELSVNRLTIQALDPTSRMPEFKICAVQVRGEKV